MHQHRVHRDEHTKPFATFAYLLRAPAGHQFEGGVQYKRPK